uniref:Putative ovule protein n=1 Tax=Solanum chacoense TaxID=4108 RepID=A0A0V0HIS5_SOLCH
MTNNYTGQSLACGLNFILLCNQDIPYELAGPTPSVGSNHGGECTHLAPFSNLNTMLHVSDRV